MSTLTPFRNRTAPATAGTQSPAAKQLFPDADEGSAGADFDAITSQQQGSASANADAFTGQQQQQQEQGAQSWGPSHPAAEGGDALPPAPQDPWGYAAYNPTFAQGAPTPRRLYGSRAEARHSPGFSAPWLTPGTLQGLGRQGQSLAHSRV